jgi:hypothetical protein
MSNQFNFCHDYVSLVHVECVDCGHHSSIRSGDKEKRPNVSTELSWLNCLKNLVLSCADFVCRRSNSKNYCICKSNILSGGFSRGTTGLPLDGLL